MSADYAFRFRRFLRAPAFRCSECNNGYDSGYDSSFCSRVCYQSYYDAADGYYETRKAREESGGK